MMGPHDKDLIDIAAGATGIMTWANILPNIAAIFTIAWLGIRIYESDTSQKLIKRWYKAWTSSK